MCPLKGAKPHTQRHIHMAAAVVALIRLQKKIDSFTPHHATVAGATAVAAVAARQHRF